MFRARLGVRTRILAIALIRACVCSWSARLQPRACRSFAAVDFFERRALPFNVAVNCFDNAPIYTIDEVRHALDLDPHIPVLLCDARDRTSTKEVLLNLVQHLIEQAGQPRVAT
ncbi:hypothetical protein [Nocardia sp. NBC_00565]|uniref:hypothetical protein n=1 Tax=Nocardia sp. NBC_00565 TaxID=2975993 RepID=UPI003FA561A8